MDDHRDTDAEGPGGSISAIPPDVCLTLLTGGVVGQVAFIGADGRQELMPVNFTVVDEAVYFRTNPTGPLSRLVDGMDNVAFGVDGFDTSTGQGWNVTARGEAKRVIESDVVRAAVASGLRQPWTGGDRDQVVRIAIREINGRRVSRT